MIALDEAGLASWGRALGEAALRARAFVALEGPLGAGKTTLVRAACEGAGCAGPVTSPTFALVQAYEGPAGRVLHADLYRIDGPSQLPALGWEELVAGEEAVFVEWAGRAGAELPPDRWHVRLEIIEGGRARGVETRALGDAAPIPDPAAHAAPAAAEPC